MTLPKEGSRRNPLQGGHRAWPSCLDPEEGPKSDTRYEIPKPDYPKRLGRTSWTTHPAAAASAAPALASTRTSSFAGQDTPMHPSTGLHTIQGTRAVLLRWDMNCQEHGPHRALFLQKRTAQDNPAAGAEALLQTGTGPGQGAGHMHQLRCGMCHTEPTAAARQAPGS